MDDPLNPNNPKPQYSFPNADRPLDSKVATQGPLNPMSNDKETVKFKDVMEQKSSKFIHDDSNMPQIETYNSDVAKAIRNDSVSALQIALAEQKKQQDRQASSVVFTESKSGPLFAKILFGILFVAIVVMGYLWWAGFLTSNSGVVGNQGGDDTVPPATQVAPIKIEQRQILSVDGRDSISIKNDIEKAKNGNVDVATIKELVLGTQSKKTSGEMSIRTLTTEEWFSKLSTHAPPLLIRSLGEDYIMGVYGSSPRETFVIFTVKSYDNAYAGMLSWESYISEDVGVIFERILPRSVTSTTTNSTIINQRIFTDKILFNKDTRILQNTDGQTRVVYSFIDPKTLIMVSSETGLRELISRLTTGKITR